MVEDRDCGITVGGEGMNTGGTKVIKGVLVCSCINVDLQNSTKTFLVGSKATDSKFFPTRTVTGPLFQSSGISSDLKYGCSRDIHIFKGL